jgi:subtilisin family serine protease
MITRPIRVAVIDSGVHAEHPHVNGVFGGVGIDSAGREHEDYVDRLGHGTAVAAVIREKAPAAEILAIKVFDHELAASGFALVAACEWALVHDSQLVNLSLGTRNPEHERPLAGVVAKARKAGAVIISADADHGTRWLPGSLPDVWGVTLDWTLPREQCRASISTHGRVSLRASGFPRPIPGVPADQNLKGLSFAVANATGSLAALFASDTDDGDPIDVLRRALARGWGH